MSPPGADSTRPRRTDPSLDESLADASLLRRVVAYVLDTLPLGVVWVAVWPEGGVRSLLDATTVLVWIVLYVGYFTIAYARYGRTFGMRALHIRVVAVAEPGDPSWPRSLARGLVQLAARLVPPLWLSLPVAVVVYGPTLFLRHHRGLHDLAASTIVVADPQRR